MLKHTFPLFHWSPRERRNSILKIGLVPNKLSKDKEWRPPYICFSKSPSLAWGLSALMSDIHGEWDLWMVWSNELPKHKTISSCNKPRCCMEYRTFERIPKRKVWYVGSRVRKQRKKTK